MNHNELIDRLIRIKDDLPNREGKDAINEACARISILVAALKGAIGALEFSRDYHSDLGNEEQVFAQDKMDAAINAIAKAEGKS